MKKIFSILLLFSNGIYAQQPDPDPSKTPRIVFEVKFNPADFEWLFKSQMRGHAGQPRIFTKDSLILMSWPLRNIELKGNTQANKLRITRNTVHLVLESDLPVMINNSFERGMNFCAIRLEPGDSLFIDYTQKNEQVTGNAVNNYEFQLALNRVMQDRPSLFAHRGLTKEGEIYDDYLQWNQICNVFEDRIDSLMNSVPNKIALKLLNWYKISAVYSVEAMRNEAFFQLAMRFRDRVIDRDKLVRVYDSTMNGKWMQWLKSQLREDYPLSDHWAFYQNNRLQVWRMVKFDVLKSTTLNTDENRRLAYYKAFKENYSGLLREKLLQYLIAKEIIGDMGYNHPLVKTILADYYKLPGFEEYKQWMRAFEATAKVKYNFGKPEPKRELSKTLKLGIQHDGPYVFYKGDTTQVNYIEKSRVKVENKTGTKAIVVSVHTDQYPKTFPVQLKKSLENEACEYLPVKKQLVISDIEGNFDQFRKLLQSNHVIDKNYNWIFGSCHLVLIGDFFDRGQQVTEVLWLIYSLEEKAKAAGGFVHFVLGNHEILNTSGDDRYVQDKYKNNAKLLNKTIKELYNEQTEIGRWLRTKNIVEKIGDILYMHGGISREVNNLKLTLQQMNEILKPHYGERDAFKQNRKEHDLMVLFNSGISPFWYRGYYLDKNQEQIIDSSFQKFGVSHIVTGHTIVADTVSMWYGGKVFNTDTHHAEGKSEALLIEGDRYYRVDGKGKKVLLFIDDKQKQITTAKTE